jgi:hypothetical protein
MKATGDTPNP